MLPLGILLRVLLSYVLHLHETHVAWSARSELTNPLHSFLAVRESVSNMQVAHVSPYAGLSSSHAPPLVLSLFASVLSVPLNAAALPRGVDAFWSSENLALLTGWCAMDVVIALMLFAIARDYYARFPSPSAPLVWVQSLARSNRVVRHCAFWTAALYMLNPLTVVSCVIFNLSHLTNLITAAMVLAAVRGRVALTGTLMAAAIYLDLYPLLAVIPVLLLLHRSRFHGDKQSYPQYRVDRYIAHEACTFIEADAEVSDAEKADVFSDFNRAQEQRDASFTPRRVLRIAYRPVPLPAESEVTQEEKLALESAESKPTPICADAQLGIVDAPAARWNKSFLLYALLCVLLPLAGLCVASFLVCGGTLETLFTSASGWSWFASSHGWSLRLPSLAANTSLFWYFFTSIFDRFHSFFLGVFHCHVFVYLPALTARFWEEPLWASVLLMHITQAFRAYPTLPSIGFGLLLLLGPNLSLLLLNLRRLYLIVGLCVVSLVTQSLMRYLWLSAQSGNANFLYFQGILFNFTHLVVVMECIGALRRRQAAVMEGQVAETIRRRRLERRRIENAAGGNDAANSSSSSSSNAESKKHA